ncbi:MAG: hypothetical protein HYV96_11015 [Opitutae bacterium]|nr:hypothetical protein [Opitutae bacterium]
MRHANVVEWFPIDTAPPPTGKILLWWRRNPMPGQVADMIFSGMVLDEDTDTHKKGEILLMNDDPNLDYRSQFSHWAYYPAGPQR